MSERILFVDDEPSLLHGIERRLGLEFNLSTAQSGEAALKEMEKNGPFAVVVADMRMPKMDGVRFIQHAREKSPETAFIMLTGNQDQGTAVQALHEGHIFRFLTKPCPIEELKKAVQAGLRQYQLVTSERELLEDTFCGAVDVLSNILEISQPQIFSRAAKVQEIMSALQNALGVEDHWEYKLAARLGLVGFAVLPEQERSVFVNQNPSSQQFQECYQSAASIGRRLIERIPRLEVVSKIIGMQAEVDGSVIIPTAKTSDEKASMGAVLLRTAVYWDSLRKLGLTPDESAEEILKVIPYLPHKMLQVLKELVTEKGEGIQVDLQDLQEGMVLAEDVVAADGEILFHRGRRLTWTIIETLRCHDMQTSVPSSVHIRDSSVKTSSFLSPVLAH